MLSSLRNLISGSRPDITPAQVAAFLVAGVPIVANLLHAFGVFTLSHEEQLALKEATTWAVVGGGALILGDAHLRGKRNDHDALVQAAALTPAAPAAAVATEGGTVITNAGPATGQVHQEPAGAPAADDALAEEEALPSDDEEFAAPPDGNAEATVKPDKP